MENEKTPIEQIEELVSFDPILYKEGRRTYIYAKQNNRLFRIVYSQERPNFFVLTPDHVEQMTMDDVFVILQNYKGSSGDEMEELFGYLIDLHKRFSKNIVITDAKQAPFLYRKACEIITSSLDFPRVHKVAKEQPATSKPAKAPKPKAKPVTLDLISKPEKTKETKQQQPAKPNPTAEQKAQPTPVVTSTSKVTPAPQPKPVATPTPVVTAVPQPVTVTETKQSEPIKTAAPVAQETVKQPEVVTTTPETTPEQAVTPKRTPYVKPVVVDLISKPKREKTETKKRPGFVPFAAIGQKPEPPKAPVEPTPTQDAKPEQSQSPKAPVAPTPTPQKTPETPVQPEPKPQPHIVSAPKLEPQQQGRVTFAPKEDASRTENTNTFYLSESATSALDTALNPTPKPAEPTPESTRKQPTANKPKTVTTETPTPAPIIAPEPAPYDGFCILEATRLSVQDTDLPTPLNVQRVSLPLEVIDFYDMHQAAPNFQTFYTIQTLKKAIELNLTHKELKNPAVHNFDFAPRLFDNQTMTFKWGDEVVSLSLNRKQPSSFIRNVKTGKIQKLTWDDVEHILIKLSDDIPELIDESIIQRFKVVHHANAFVSSENYPTVQQAVEEHALRTVLKGNQIGDVPATLCSGRTIMARRGNRYLKVVLGGNPIFEAFENGAVSQMTAGDVSFLDTSLHGRYPAQVLRDYRASNLKKVFAKSHRKVALQEAPAIVTVKIDPSLKLHKQIEALTPLSLPRQSRNGSKRAQPVPTALITTQGQKPMEKTLEDAAKFYTWDTTRPEFHAEMALQQLRLEYAQKNPSFTAPEATPLIDERNHLYHVMGGVTFVLSLDTEHPLFIKIYNSQVRPMSGAELGALIEAVISNKEKAAEYKALFAQIHASIEKQSAQRPNRQDPSVQQVFEIARFKSLLTGATTLQNVDPTFCTGNILVAKYGDVLFKITLNPLTFGAYENGAIRRMTRDEIRHINRFMLHIYNYHHVTNKGANDLLFRSERADSPKDISAEAHTKEMTPADRFVAQFKDAMKQPASEPQQQLFIPEQTEDLTEAQIRQAFSFYPEAELRGDWEYQQEIEKTIATLSTEDRQKFTPLRYPYLSQNDCLFLPQGDELFVVSTDLSKPYYRRVDEKKEWLKMGDVAFHNAVVGCFADIPNNDIFIQKWKENFSKFFYTPNFETPTIKTFPSLRQVLALAYARALATGSKTLPDIEATVCNNQCICARKGNVFYKITLGSPNTYTALQDGSLRLMTIDEVRDISRELQQKYGILYLPRRGIRPFVRQYQSEAGLSSERYDTHADTAIRDLFDFNTGAMLLDKMEALRQTIETGAPTVENNEDKIYLTGNPVVSIADFWRDPDIRVSPYFQKEIEALRQQIQPKTGPSEPIITTEDCLFFEHEKFDYYISLNFDKPMFLRQSKGSKNIRAIPIDILKEFVSEWFKDDLEKRNLILQKITALYDKNVLKKDPKHGLPSIKQVIELYDLKRQLNPETPENIPATICLNDTVVAKHDNRYYKMMLSAQQPVYMCLENGVVRPMNEQEIKRIHRELAYQYHTIVLTRFELKQSLLLERGKQSFTPFIYKEKTHQSAITAFGEAILQFPVEPASREEAEQLFGHLTELDTQKIEHRPFIEDGDQLPDYETLYQTEWAKYRLQYGPDAREEDFTFPPVLCSDRRVHYKDEKYEYTFSLDEHNPHFACVLSTSGKASFISLEKFLGIIDLLTTIPEKREKLHHLCKRLYNAWELSTIRYARPQIPSPRFDQTLEHLKVHAQLNGELLGDFNPVFCNDGIIYTQQKGILFKIRTNEPFVFEAFENNTARLMTLDEFKQIVDVIRNTKRKFILPVHKLLLAINDMHKYKRAETTVRSESITATFTWPTAEQTADAILAATQFNAPEQSVEIPTIPNLMPRIQKAFPGPSAFPELATFLDYENNPLNFNWLQKNEQIKAAIRNNNSDLQAIENTMIELPTVYGNDGRIHVQQGKHHTSISLDPENAFFGAVYLSSGNPGRISLPFATQTLAQTLHFDPDLQRAILDVLPAVYTDFATKKRIRGKVLKTRPRFDQVIENATLEAQLLGKEPPQDIAPMICAGMLLCAKYENAYYKISLTDDPVFEIFENGVIRDMNAKEFNRILQDVEKNNLYNVINQNDINALKNAFYRKRKTAQKAKETATTDSRKQFVGGDTLVPDLPTFTQLLTGKKEAANIPATLCADNCVYARKNHIYYKITLTPPFTFEALKNDVKRLMKESEFITLWYELSETYTKEYAKLLNLRELKTAFYAQLKIQKEAERAKQTTLDTEQKTTIVRAPEQTPVVEAPVIEEPVIVPEPEITPAPIVEPAKEIAPEPVAQPMPTPEEKPKKRLGRPKGSKNKPKTIPAPVKEVQPIIETVVTEPVVEKPAAAPAPEITPKPKQPAQPLPTPPAPPIGSKRVKSVVKKPKEKPAEPIKIAEQPPLPTPKPEVKAEQKTEIRPTEGLLRPEDIPEYHPPKFIPMRHRPKRDIDEDDDLLSDTPKETPEETLCKLLFPPKEKRLLTPETYPEQPLPVFPEDMCPLPTNDFFAPVDCLPDFQTLYATLIYNARRELGLRKFPNNEDILYFDIAPILCNDNILICKKDNLLYQISLNAETPRFVVRDLIARTDSRMVWKDVKTVLTDWLNDDEQVKNLMTALTPLYAQYQQAGVIEPLRNVPPSFEQLYARCAAEVSYLKSINAYSATQEVNDFSILPTRCAGDTIWTKIGRSFYKISIAEPTRFERHTGMGTYLMTRPEFEKVMKLAQEPKSKAFRKGTLSQASTLLRDLFRAHENIFRQCRSEQVSVKQYKSFLENGFISSSGYERE